MSRLFAFLAVSCAIAAVAWASRAPLVLAIGILGLAAGHYYSWRRRDNISTRRTLVLFFFMLILTIYLGRDMLLYGAGDRVLLAHYLIYGLALGSFDLMRKRNLLASLILGALLLTIISEVALDLWFLVFPVVFMALSLVAVVTSRIEAETSQAVTIGILNWRTIGKVCLAFTAVILLVSTTLFLLMPRVTSRQVAQANWLPSRLDLSLDGSATLPNKPSALAAPGVIPSRREDGPRASGEYVTLGYAGSLADRPVMHVRSRVSSYWRGVTLDEYDGKGWLRSSSKIELLDEGRREFVLPDSKQNVPGDRVYWQAYYLLSDQPNAIFTGYRPGKIYLPDTGQVRLEEGTLYRTLSVVPRLRPEQLRRDRVVSEEFSELALPPISERTAALAESVVRGAATDYDRAARLERFLLDNYPYDLNVEPLPPGRDAADFFLFEQQAGYCSHFATTMAVMARHVGLPTRVAAGYLPGFIDPLTGTHIVRNGDAHSWVEVHFEKHGWVAFDPTPTPDAAMGFASGRNLVYFGLEDFTGVTLSSMLSPLGGNLSLGSISLSGWAWFLLLIVVVITAIQVLRLVYRRRMKTGQETKEYSILGGESRRAMAKIYQSMVRLLTRKGLPARLPFQPPYEYADIVVPQIPDGREAMYWLTQAISRAAYNPVPFDPADIREAKLWLSALKRAINKRH
jgi:hypothetical protein